MRTIDFNRLVRGDSVEEPIRACISEGREVVNARFSILSKVTLVQAITAYETVNHFSTCYGLIAGLVR